MKKHVILLAESRSEFASELLDTLNSAGIGVFSDPLAGGPAVYPPAGLLELQQPVALVFELPKPTTSAKLRAIVERAHESWPGIPLVVCQNAGNLIESKTKRQLTKLGFRVLPSETNFILARPPLFSANDWLQKLRERKILVRWFNAPEVQDYLRITIGTQREAQALVRAVKSIL